MWWLAELGSGKLETIPSEIPPRWLILPLSVLFHTPLGGVIDFILSHLDDNNKLCLTQRQACKEIQAQELKEGRKNFTSMTTVNQTFKALVEANALTKKGSIYILNPKLANAFGSDRKNRAILLEFEDAQMWDRLRKLAEKDIDAKAEKVSQIIKENFENIG